MPGPTPPRSPAPGVPRWVPGLLAAVGVGCTLAAVALAVWTHTGVPVAAGDAVLGLLYPLVATLVLRRRPGNRVGWLLMATAVTGPYLLAGEYAARAVLVEGDTGSLAELATWMCSWGFAAYYPVVGLAWLYFPDGQLPSPRWRPVARLLAAAVVLAALAAMIRPGALDIPGLTNPWAPTQAMWPNYVLAACSLTVFFVGTPVGVAALVVRMRRSTGVERTQLQWLVLGAAVLLTGVIASLVIDQPVVSETLFAVGFAAVPAAVAGAVLRHGLFDVGQVVSRAVVFTLLSVLLLVAYAGLVALVGEFSAGERRFAVAAAAAAALAAAAGWERAQRGVDRLLYGERRDPLAVASRIGSTLDLAAGPADALQALVDEVARVLRLPRVEVVPADARLTPTVSLGRATGADVDVMPLAALGEPVGELRVTHRSPGERWRRTERSALADVARRAATLVWAEGLVADLQASRERIVAGREEERRRLRHDLHDGVGPELAGMALQLERLAGKLAGEPDLAALAGRLRDQMRRTVAAVRRAVDDLRPPALDELGLVGALREHVAAYRLAVSGHTGDDGEAPAPVTVDAADLPPLRAAVEVAAYRIATEAVANAVRHSGAATCRVRLGVTDGDLLVEVADDGRGVAPGAVPGVGSTSMRERAAELGGTLEIETAPGEGTTVRTRLPLAAR